MRSFKTTVTAAAVLAAGVVLTAPAAHAATSLPQLHSPECRTAVATALKAESDYDAAVADMKKQIAMDGHPGTAEESNIASLLNDVNATASTAARICGHTGPSPHGGTHTGVGSTSQGVSTTEVAAGLGLLGAVGAGAVALRRRRAGGEA